MVCQGDEKLATEALASPPNPSEDRTPMTNSESTHVGTKTTTDESDGNSVCNTSNSVSGFNTNESVHEEGSEGESEPDKKKRKMHGGITHEERWEEMFNRLLKFRTKNGHCLVPNRYAGDPQLGTWVATQRRQYKILLSPTSQLTAMTPQRAIRLQQIGFEWAPKKSCSEFVKKGQLLKDRDKLQGGVTHEERWEEMFTRLIKFRSKNGHCLVPNRFPEDPQLGTWVATQRRQYKTLLSPGSRSTAMTPHRAIRLQEIGFEWAPKDSRTVPWNVRFMELVQFVKKHGHAQVHMRMEGNEALSNWISQQRQEYKLMQKGQSSHLTPDHVKLLDGLGFVWDEKRVSTPPMVDERDLKTGAVIPTPLVTLQNLQYIQQRCNQGIPPSTDELRALSVAEQELDKIRKNLTRQYVGSKILTGIAGFNTDRPVNIESDLLSLYGPKYMQSSAPMEGVPNYSMKMGDSSLGPLQLSAELQRLSQNQNSILSTISQGLKNQFQNRDGIASGTRGNLQEMEAKSLPAVANVQ